MLSLAELQARDQALEREHFAQFEARVASDTVDPNWAPIATNAIHQAFHTPELSAIRVHGVDCRSRWCRLVVALPPASELPEAVEPSMVLLAEVDGTFARLSMQVIDAERRVIYLARDDAGFRVEN